MAAFPNERIQFTLANGTKVSNVVGSIEQNSTEATFDLSAATMNGVYLAPGTAVQITFVAATDMAGNIISPNPSTVTVKREIRMVFHRHYLLLHKLDQIRSSYCSQRRFNHFIHMTFQ